MPAWLTETIARWKPLDRLGGNAWAESRRTLSRVESPLPGKWRSAPWQREVLDALADPLVTFLAILKAAQMGASELIRCAIGRWSELDPGDVLWVMTTQDAAEKTLVKVRAMFASTECLRPLLSGKKKHDKRNQLVLTNGMKIVIAWSGSPQSMASDPFRYVILDEVAKYSTVGTKGEANAVSLAGERTKVYGRRGKIILLSSPRHDNDLICTNHRQCADRRIFCVPCGHCGVVQPLLWESVRWLLAVPSSARVDPTARLELAGKLVDEPSSGTTRWLVGEPSRAPIEPEARLRLADEIEGKDGRAWIECSSCHRGFDSGKALRDPRCAWVLEPGATEGGVRRGYHVTELLHWETTLRVLVGKFLRCIEPSTIQGFYNGSLGVPNRSESSEIKADLFAARAIYPKGVIPSWATCVISSADTQLRGWWFMVRAWARGGRSRLLDWGWAASPEELAARALDVRFPVEGESDVFGEPRWLAVDSGGGMARPDGSRTKDTYEFVRAHRRCYALKGESEHESLQGKHSRKTSITFAGAPLDLWLVNRNFYGDELHELIRSTAPVLWEECRGAENPTYGRQMASEEKVLIQSERGTRSLWQKKAGHVQNHMRDLARYQVWAASELARVDARTVPTWKGPRAQEDLPDDEQAEGSRRRWVIGRES